MALLKVALYARVSKSDLDEKGDPIQKPENQLIPLREYAKDKGYTIHHEYVDFASGANANRPSLDQMIRDAKGHRFTLILITKIDRIARSNTNLYSLLSTLDAFSVKIHCIDQPDLSTDTPMGKLLISVLGGVAEFERELIRERVKSGMARVKAEGIHIGRPKSKIDDAELQVLRDQKMSIRKMAKHFGVAPETVRRRLKNVSQELS